MRTPRDDAWRMFWAKTNRGSDNGLPTRPLWAHLLDVAHTALLLWGVAIPDHAKRQVARDLKLSIDEAGHLLSFWIGLHDIGKAIPSFQSLHPHSRNLLENAGFRFHGYNERKHHGHASIPILITWLRASSSPGPVLEQIAAWIGAHHGRLYPQEAWEEDVSNPAILGDKYWKEARHSLLEAIQSVWFDHYPVANNPTSSHATFPVWLPVFGGWATLADWLGSMASCFPLRVDKEPGMYVESSRAGAERALRMAGFVRLSGLRNLGFEELFSFAPNPLQQALIDLPLPDGDAPTLVIIEGPTGEGKTEGSFVLAARQQAHTRGNGLYIGMPTQATSNGLFRRTIDFLSRADPGHVNFRLVHGNADLHPEQDELISRVEDLEPLFDDDEKGGGDETRNSVRTLDWFLPRKRSLLASYGLGTVDQAFLSVLYARHFFLRLFALAGKTVIFDEVHAYDLYMQHLFTRILQWLHALGSHVIILSATLPSHMRNAFLKAWGGTEPPRDLSGNVPYPAIWLAQNGTATLEAAGFATRWTQRATLQRHDPEPASVAETAVKAYKAGAVVLVICNTVRRAQEVYCALPAELKDRHRDVVLLHARYRFGIRQQKEAAVLERFGRKRQNGEGGILIATQLAEQSLDLDADVLLTDPAPIDLLLQRAGRLHRHLDRRPSHDRPAGFTEPKVYWMCRDSEEGRLPNLSDIGVRTSRHTVYLPTIVWKTWVVLRERTSWILPDEYRPLIEAVYGERMDPPARLAEEGEEMWNQAVRLFERLDEEAQKEARRQLIPEPNSWGLQKLLDPDKSMLADADDDDAHPSRRVLTRLGAESVEALLLFEAENGVLYLDPEYSRPAPLDRAPGEVDLPVGAVRELLQNVVRISYEDIARALTERDEDKLPVAWRAAAEHTAALHRLLPVILRNRTAEEGGYRITDDDALGVCIERLK